MHVNNTMAHHWHILRLRHVHIGCVVVVTRLIRSAKLLYARPG